MGDCAGLLLSYFSIISLPTSSDFSGQRDKGLRSRKDHVRVEQLEEEEMSCSFAATVSGKSRTAKKQPLALQDDAALCGLSHA